MNMALAPWQRGVLAGLLLLLAGCATYRIDWDARVGNYTYDQAILEIGPPDKQANLTDGTVVAEWLTHRGHPEVYGWYGYGHPYGYYGAVYPAYATGYSPDYYLRLVFAPDGKLTAWKQLVR